jgi:acyl-CoA thioesterase FadM
MENRVSIKEYNGIKLILAYEFYDKTFKTITTTAESTHAFLYKDRIASLKKCLPRFHELLKEIIFKP